MLASEKFVIEFDSTEFYSDDVEYIDDHGLETEFWNYIHDAVEHHYFYDNVLGWLLCLGAEFVEKKRNEEQ